MPDRRILTVLLLVAFVVFPGTFIWSQSNIPAEPNNWLQQAAPAGNGSTDLFTVIFFEIPSDAVADDDFIYIGINDAGTDGVVPDQFSGTTDYYVFGGTGALTDATSRQRVFGSLVETQAGRQLGFFTADSSATYNITGGESSHWTYFNGVRLSDGEQIGSRVYFKVVVDAETNGGSYKNAFQVDLSRFASGVPTQISGVRSFAYSWPIYNAETNDATFDWTIYPFVSNSMDTEDLGLHGWDFDGTGNTADLYDKSGSLVINDTSLDGSATVFPDDATEAYHTIVTLQTNGYWKMELTEGSGSGYEDAAEVFFSVDNGSTGGAFDVNDGLVRAYSAESLISTNPDYVAVMAEDGIAVNDGTDVETVTLQIVDSSGTPLPYSMSITVNVDGSATIDYVNGGLVASAQSQSVLTDADGLATIGVVDNANEVVAVTVDVFASANETAAISFEPDPEPTLETAGNTSIDLTTTVTLPRVTITETGGSTVITRSGGTETLQLRIPGGLDASFAASALDFAAGGGDITAASYTNTGGSTITIEPSATFSIGDIMTIDGIQVTAGATETTGYLELSYDNGSSWNVVDIAPISTVSTLTNSYVWTGAAGSTVFNDNANWSPVGVPGGTDSAYIPASPSLPVWPDLDNGSVSPTVGQLVLETGASFDAGNQNLTLNQGLFVDGTLTVGTGTLSVGDDTVGGGTITAGSGNITFSGDLEVDTYTATSATTYVGGDFGPTTFTNNGGTVEFDGTGDQTVTSGVNTFSSVILNKTNGSLSFSDGLTVLTGMSVGAGVAFDLSFNADSGAQSSSVAGATVLTNTGSTTFGNASGDAITFVGGLTATSGVKSLAGSLLSEGAAIDLNSTALTLTAASTIDTTSGVNPTGATITAAAITGASALTVNAGTLGTVIQTGTWGDAADLASLDLDAAGFTQGATVEASGLIDIAVSGGIAVNFLISSSAGDVNLTSAAGSITDGSLAETALISGATVTLSAVNGTVGAADPADIEISAATALNADTSTGGGAIAVDSIGALTIGQLDAGTGTVTLTSSGAVDAAANDGTADILGSTVSITTTAGGIGTAVIPEVTATGTVTASSNDTNILLESIGALTIGQLDAGTGSVTLTSTGAVDAALNDGTADILGSTVSITTTAGGIGTAVIPEVTATGTVSAASNNTNILLESIGALTIGQLDAGTGSVTLTSTGAVDAAANDGTADILGSTVSITTTAGGIGTAVIPEVTATGTVTASSNDTNILLESIGALTIGQLDAGTGSVTLTSTGAVDAALNDGTADILGSTVSVTTTAGGIGTAVIPEVTATGAVSAASNNTNILLESLGNLGIGVIDAGTASVTLSAPAGSISDFTGTAAVDVLAGTVDFDALNGIGTVNQIQMSGVTAVSADTTGAAAVDLTNTVDANVTVSSLTTVGSTIDFVQTGQTGANTLTVGGTGVSSGSGVVSGGTISITGNNGVTVGTGVDTSIGSGGTLSILDGVTVNTSPTLGAGDIILDGTTGAVVLNAAITVTGSLAITVAGDIDIGFDITAAGAASDLSLTADGDDDGAGGIRIQAAGSVNAGRDILLEGSDFAVTGNGLVIAADGANPQAAAGRNFSFSPRAAAPAAETNVDIAGIMQSVGTLDISARGNVALSGAAADFTSGGGNVTVTADSDGTSSGSISMVDGSSIDAGAGTIDLVSFGDLDLGRLVTTNATAAAVSVSSTGGAIIDVNTAGDDIVAAGTATLSSAGSIGDISGGTGDVTGAAVDPVEIDVAAVDVSATGVGSEIALTTTAAGLLTVAGLDAGTGATGYTLINATNNLTVSAMSVGNADNLGLVSTAGTLTIPNAAISTTGVVRLVGGTDVTDGDYAFSVTASDLYFSSGGGTATTLNSTITTLTASMSNAGTDLTVSETNGITLATVTTNGGDFSATAGGAGSIEVNTITTGGAAGTVLLSAAGGAITDTDTNSSIIALNLDLSAAGLIGGANPINTTVATILDSESTGVGNIYIDNSAAVAVNHLNNTNGDIRLDAGGDVTDANLAAVNYTATNLVLNAAGGIDGDTAAADISATTSVLGAIQLDEADAVTLSSITAVDGPITITNGTAATTITATSVVSSTDAEANDISITSAGDIVAGTINAGVATGDVVLIAASGDISDSTSSITAQDLSFTSGGIVGGATPINTTAVNYLSSSAGGNVYLRETDGVAMDDITTSGTLRIDTLAGSLTDGNAGVLNLSATALTLSAAANIEADTDVDSVSATSTTAGTITLREADGITLTSVTAADGDITLSNAAGNIIVGSVTADAADDTVQINSAGSITDLSTDTIADVTALTVDLTAAAGGIGTAVANGALDVDAAGQVDADTTGDGANIYLYAVANLPAGLLAAGTGDILLSVPSGAVSDANGVLNNAAGGLLDVSAINGIDLDTAVVSADLSNTTLGAVNIDEADDIDIAGISQTAAGTVTVDTNLGDITVTVAGTGVSAAGGAVTLTAAADINLGSDISNIAGPITLASDVVLLNTVTVDSGAGAGDILFAGTVDWDGVAVNRDLTVAAGAGDTTLSGVIGGTLAVNDLDLSGANITLNGIGSGAVGANDVVAEASTLVTLQGSADYRSTGLQSYNQVSGADSRLIALGANADLEAAPQVRFADLYIDFDPLRTVTLLSDLYTRNFVFYGGTLDIKGNTVSTQSLGGGDFIVFGTAYNGNDTEATASGGGAFAYPANGALTAPLFGDPGAGNYDAGFADLVGSTIDIVGAGVGVGATGNFYVNGADLVGSLPGWTLNVRNNSISNPLTNGPWGSPFNIVFNSTVTYGATVNGGAVAAAAAGEPAGYINNNVTDGGNNETGTATSWDFIPPQILSGRTLSDDLLELVFSEPLRNDVTVDDITATIGAGNLKLDDGNVDFTAAYSDAGTTPVLNQGDLSTFYLASPQTWNTDADGNGDGDNDAVGTDSTDRAGVTKSITPHIRMRKTALYDLAGNRVINYDTSDGGGEYTGVTDECEPVVVSVYADRDNGSGGNIDYHNYLRMLYSEPVNLGDLSIGAAADANIQSQATFNAGEHGGNISGSGTVTVEGYFTYPGTLDTDSRTVDDQVTALRRRGAAYGQEVYFYIAGYDDGNGYTWPGVILPGVTDPAAAAVTLQANLNVTDASSNSLDIANGPAITISEDPDDGLGDVLPSWDITPPTVAPFQPGALATTYYEIVTKDNDSNTVNDRIEFFVLDDSSDFAAWDSDNHHMANETGLGLRDVSVTANVMSAMGLALVPGAGVGNIPGSTFTTATTDSGVASLFKLADIDANDRYFSITFLEDEGFTDLDQLYFSYQPGSADEYATDLAGNVLESLLDVKCIERTPPRILYSLAVVGDDKIYVKFSEPIWQDAALDIPIDNTDFNVTGGYTVTSVDILSFEIGGAKEAYLNLDAPLTEDDVIGEGIDSMTVQDQVVNNSDPTVIKSITDVGLGLMAPVWASDGLHTDSSFGGGFSTVRAFDGTGKVMDRDVTLQASILAPSAVGYGTSLIYDANVPASVLVDGFWLPFQIPEYNPAANLDVRILAPSNVSGALRDFLIPSGDPEMEAGNDLEFIFKLGNLYCARSLDSEDPRKIAPWILPVRDLTRQTAGVTILNNVINPNEGELAVLSYELADSGMVTITVFGLDGDVVDVIQRGTQASGEHTATWDGRNRGGRIVARGIYFIRVVGPGFDEYRKVIVVK